MSRFVIRWMPLRDAHAFIARHHRHHVPAQGGIVALGIWEAGMPLIGVGIIGRPTSRLQLPNVCEITLTCILENNEHAASALLGRLRRVAQSLGFVKMVTYTLPRESGASLRAAGWHANDLLTTGGSWGRPSRKRAKANHPVVRKIRWWRDLKDQSELEV